MDNILINFTADPAGLQPGIEGLEQLKTSDQELAAAIAKTTAAETARNKALSDGAKASQKNVDGLTTSFNNLSKINIGAAFNKTFADLKNSLNLSNEQLKAFYQNIKTNSQQQILKGGSTTEIETLQELIKGADAALAELGSTSDQTGNKTQSLRVQLRLVREELQVLEQAGLEGTAAFEALQLKAGALSDQMQDTGQRIKALSSDTFVFDAIGSALQGVVGGFTALSGAAALFGSENQDLQQALLKVNAAMALLQGLQSLGNVLQRQSAASIAIDLILRKNQAAATTAVAVVEGELAVETEAAAVATTELTAAVEAETAATGEALVATEALNTAMAINPAFILVGVIAALAAGLLYFTRTTEDSNEKQKAYNDTLAETNSIMVDLARAYTESSRQNVTNAEKALALATAQGAGETELYKLRQASASAKKLEGISILANLGLTKQDIDLNNVKLQSLNEQLHATLALVTANNSLSKDDQKKVDNIKSQIAAIKTVNDAGIAALKSINDAQTETETNAAEHTKTTYEESVKSATAALEARVALAKKGSKAELDGQIAAINAETKAATDKTLNPNITKGEIDKILADAKRQIQDLQNNFQVKALQDVKTGIDAQVLMSQQGSKEEYDLKLQSLAAENKAELASNNLTDNQRRNINAKFYRDAQALSKAFYKKVSEDAINQDIAETNTKISQLEIESTGQTNDQLLALKEKLITDQANLEIVAIRASEDNEKLKEAKIAAVYAKELADKKQLEADKAAAEIRSSADSKIKTLQDDINANSAVINSANSTSEQKRLAREKQADDLAAIARKESIEADRIEALGVSHYKEAQELRTKATEDGAKARAEKEMTEEERTALKWKEGEEIIQNSIQATITALKARYEGEIAQAQDLYDKKEITETEYNNRVKAAKRKEAVLDRDKALFDIAIATAKNIVDVAPNFALIAFAAALGATQAAIVLAQPLPQYKTGMINIDGPGTATSDSILARISKGESVINADMTGKHREALEAINSNRFQEYLQMQEMPKMWADQFSMPVIPTGMEAKVQKAREFKAALAMRQAMPVIDYDRMGDIFAQKVAKELALNPHLSVSLDETGFVKSIQKGLDQIAIKNKRMRW